MTYVIAEPCVDVMDRSCVDLCPVDCIYPGGNMMLIQPDECINCGACENSCPVEAIFFEDDVPEQWTAYVDINRDHFTEIGSPGGACRVRLQQLLRAAGE
jgi:ferredoxin